MAIDRKALMEQADHLVAKGQVGKALLEYKKLLTAFPGDVNLLNRVGDLYLQAGMTEEALSVLKALAAAFRHEQQDKKAIAILKRIVKLAPGDRESAQQLAEMLLATGGAREAAQLYFQIADHLERTSKAEEALEAFAKGVATDSSHLELRLALAGRYAAAGHKEKAAGCFLDAAEALALARRGDEALSALEQAAALTSGARIILSRARILDILGHQDEALASIEKALDAYPNNPTLVEALAELLIHMGRPAEGIRRLRDLRQLTDRVLPLCEQALHDLVEAGQFRLALRLFRPMAHDLASKGCGPAVRSTLKVAFKGVQHPVLWILHAEVALEAEEQDEAMMALRQACSLSIERTSDILTRLIQRKIEAVQGQKKSLTQIVTEQASQRTMMMPLFGRQQRDPKIKLQLDQMEKEAGSQVQLGNLAGAINLFQQVLTMEPGRYTAIHSLVQAFVHTGQIPKAQTQCIKSAEVLGSMGRKQEARQILDLAELHVPGSTNAPRRLLGLD